jgi:hypothetical protein
VAALRFWRWSGSARSGCARGALRNRTTGRRFQDGMDDDERQAVREEGRDPGDRDVRAAIGLVRWERSLCGRLGGVAASRRRENP